MMRAVRIVACIGERPPSAYNSCLARGKERERGKEKRVEGSI